MRRGRPLRADPSKTAAWQQRGRAQGLKRGQSLKPGEELKRGAAPKRRAALKQAPPARRVTTPPEVWAAAVRRDGGRCVWSRYLGVKRRAHHPHHLLPKGAGEWPEYAGVRENIVSLAADRHMTHEFSPRDRLPWEALPAECRAFLRKVAARDARAERLIVVKYPSRAAPGDHPVRRAT